MDKSCLSSGDSTTTTASTTTATSSSGSNTNSRDQYLKQLNKLSHKISKPNTTASSIPVKKPGFDPHPNLHDQAPPPSQSNNNQGNLHQHQPPVYNINKSDFRDVVQRLTGSPAHERISAPPPPIHPPKPQSSRLQRIRPPPLAHVSNRPPPLLNSAVIPPANKNPNANPAISGIGSVNSATEGFIPQPTAPLSPLPPLPPVHAAAESPVSAYMRYLQNSISTTDSNPKQFSGFSPLAPLVSPRWYQTSPAPQQQQENKPPQQQNIPPPPPPLAPLQQQGILPPAPTSFPGAPPQQFQFPQSPLPFGCLNSPRSPYPLLSPSLLFSPTSGQLGFPLSPTVPFPSPKYKGL